MDLKPPLPVDLVQQRRLVAEAKAKARPKSKSKTKAKAKAKAKPKVHFRLKFQNRNGVEMPSIFDNEESKQILQLSTKVDPDATDKVREWVRKFFTTKKQTLQLSCMNAMKSRQGPDPVRAAKLAAIRNESDVATPCFLSVGRLRFLPPCSAGPAWPDPSCCPALCPLPCALCPLPPLPPLPSDLWPGLASALCRLPSALPPAPCLVWVVWPPQTAWGGKEKRMSPPQSCSSGVAKLRRTRNCIVARKPANAPFNGSQRQTLHPKP